VFYCDRECQKKDWKGHKAVCAALQDIAKNKKVFVKKIITEGAKGQQPGPGNEVFVHYTGTLPNGRVFDSSKTAPNSPPFKFLLGLGQVIQGWDEGVRTMNKGEKAQLVISADAAYGKDGSPPRIPPNTPLVFEIELLDFRSAEIMKTGTNFL